MIIFWDFDNGIYSTNLNRDFRIRAHNFNMKTHLSNISLADGIINTSVKHENRPCSRLPFLQVTLSVALNDIY